MTCFTDLHMHSCLSPCGDELMTPSNICGMAKIKGLDMIAVCDHNTARQLPAIKAVADAYGVALLPGMEITTREEVHLLSYFKTVDEALAFSEWIYPHLPDIPNAPDFFGHQYLMNDDDEVVSEEKKLLLSALDLSIDDLCEEILARGGAPVPAHINRGSNGILQALGFLPDSLHVPAVEISRSTPCPEGYEDMHRLYSSDAHRLEDIFERIVSLNLQEPTPEAFFEWIFS